MRQRITSWLIAFSVLFFTLTYRSVFAQPDLTPLVERLGNPFTARFPDGEWVYARNVWDMEVYADLLYMGHGNSTTEPPAGNAGPVEIWSFNGSTFTPEFLVNEEEIERFLIEDGQLVIPGHDSTYPSPGGNFYLRLSSGRWQEVNGVLEAAHVYDMAAYNGRFFAATGTSSQNGAAIGISDDGGSTWTGIPLIAATTEAEIMHSEVAWELFETGGELLVSAQPAIRVYQLEDGTTQRTAVGPMVYHYANNAFEPLAVDLFPGFTFDINQERSFRVARPVNFGDSMVYVGARVNQQQWTPFGLFLMRAEGGNFVTARLPLPNREMLPWDTWIDGNTLYVLGSQCANQFYAPCEVSVVATCDLVGWHTILQFTTETFARSFALYRGDFYFGMGSQPDTLAPSTGDILRIRRDLFVPDC
jgi:hypothetical protein